MTKRLIHSITNTYASGDGATLSVARTRLLPDGVTIVADCITAVDLDAFAHAPFNGRPGTITEITSQESADHRIPDSLWSQHFDLLCKDLQLSCVQRGVPWERRQEHLGTIYDNPAVKTGLVVCMPSGFPTTTYLNDRPIEEFAKDAAPGNAEAETFLSAMKNAQHNDVSKLNLSKPPTWDPHYKDSDIPDDIDTYENDIPF